METTDNGRYAYGLQGICDLFGVSKTTAMLYKRTFLAPAVRQRGRKIVTDVGKALELFARVQDNGDCGT